METTTFWEECAAQANQDRRRQSRLTFAVPIRVAGISSLGELFSEDTETTNVSQTGCQFSLGNTELTPGSVVAIRTQPRSSTPSPHSRAGLFRVQWCRRESNGRHAVGAMQLNQEGMWELEFPNTELDLLMK